MLYRNPPRCLRCNGVIHPVYRDQSDLPPQLQVIGDTFSHWDYDGHICDNPHLGGPNARLQPESFIKTKFKK